MIQHLLLLIRFSQRLHLRKELSNAEEVQLNLFEEVLL